MKDSDKTPTQVQWSFMDAVHHRCETEALEVHRGKVNKTTVDPDKLFNGPAGKDAEPARLFCTWTPWFRQNTSYALARGIRSASMEMDQRRTIHLPRTAQFHGGTYRRVYGALLGRGSMGQRIAYWKRDNGIWTGRPPQHELNGSEVRGCLMALH